MHLLHHPSSVSSQRTQKIAILSLAIFMTEGVFELPNYFERNYFHRLVSYRKSSDDGVIVHPDCKLKSCVFCHVSEGPEARKVHDLL
jgi:hypothetical protein